MVCGDCSYEEYVPLKKRKALEEQARQAKVSLERAS